MASRIFRAVLIVVVTLAAVVLGAIAALADLSDRSRTAVALALAITTTMVYLLARPMARPSPAEAATRSQLAWQTGSVLARLVWFIQAVLVGVLTYSVAMNLDQPGFRVSVAVLVVIVRLSDLLFLGAQDLAGFRIDWRFLHGRRAVRFSLNTLVAAAIAGYANTLVDVTTSVLGWVPIHTYRLLAGWGLGTILAVLGTIPVTLLYLVALFVVGIVLKQLASAVLGRDNVVSEWLDDNLPVTVERSDDDLFADFPLDHDWPSGPQLY